MVWALLLSLSRRSGTRPASHEGSPARSPLVKPALGFGPPFAPRTEAVAVLELSVRTRKARVTCSYQLLNPFRLPCFRCTNAKQSPRIWESGKPRNEKGLRRTRGAFSSCLRWGSWHLERGLPWQQAKGLGQEESARRPPSVPPAWTATWPRIAEHTDLHG